VYAAHFPNCGGNFWELAVGSVSANQHRDRLRVNSPEAVHEAVNTGLRVGYRLQWLFEDGLKNSNLRRLLSEDAAPPVTIQIPYVANRPLPKRAIVFMDFIMQMLSRVSALSADAATISTPRLKASRYLLPVLDHLVYCAEGPLWGERPRFFS
jgi:DNA-binding transcriptional LysR family regulator